MDYLNDENWAIFDDTKMLFSGNVNQILFIWNLNNLLESDFDKNYGNVEKRPEYIITAWTGNLKMIQIIDEVPFGPGEHKVSINDFFNK